MEVSPYSTSKPWQYGIIISPTESVSDLRSKNLGEDSSSTIVGLSHGKQMHYTTQTNNQSRHQTPDIFWEIVLMKQNVHDIASSHGTNPARVRLVHVRIPNLISKNLTRNVPVIASRKSFPNHPAMLNGRSQVACSELERLNASMISDYY